MRDNWMTLSEFTPGDQIVEISHTMLVERLRYLPGNEIEGNQTLMVRGILEDEASTNLVAHLRIMGSEPAIEEVEQASLVGVALVVLVLLVAVLISILAMVLIRNRDEDEEKEDLSDEEVLSTES